MLAQWLERRASYTEGHEFDSHTSHVCDVYKYICNVLRNL